MIIAISDVNRYLERGNICDYHLQWR